jgi:hypothetical protein
MNGTTTNGNGLDPNKVRISSTTSPPLYQTNHRIEHVFVH